MKLQDAVVVITGASSGLGKKLAYALASKGCHVVVSARNRSQLDVVAQETKGYAVVADVKKERHVQALAKKAIERFGRIDIWINDAGVHIPHASIEDMDMKRVHEMFEVNFFGVLYGAKAALQQMKKQGSGTIINILSTIALKGLAGASGYAASKYAAAGFTKTLRLEAVPANLKVIEVYPGGMRTNFFDEQKPDDYEQYMDPSMVAEKIINNLESEAPLDELIIKRPVQ